MANIGLVVLAAGGSARLGKPKQLLPYQQKTLLQHVLDQASEYPFDSKILVLGAYAAEILGSIDAVSFTVIVHEGWKEGMASSLRKGVAQALADSPDLEHLLFLLSDQPFVSGELMQSLVSTQLEQDNLITACRYQGQLGVPAIFHKSLFPELLRLQGDRGANSLIRAQGDRVGELAFELGIFDVDTEDDFGKLFVP
jgi:molybdenum cofactor cytidylyltransferase